MCRIRRSWSERVTPHGRQRSAVSIGGGTSRFHVEPLEERALLSLAGNQLFPADSPWNHPITDAPVAANSATLVSSIGAAKPLHPDFGTTFNGTLNGIPYNVVSGSQPKVNVTIDAYPDESDLQPVPIPANAVIEGDAPGGAADYQRLPSYAQASLSGQNQATWDTSSTDPRAIQDPLNPSNRVASTWYSGTQFTLNLNITDGNAHRIAMYLLDWDSLGRSENVSALNPANGQVLATQAVSNFSGGTYLVFDVTGSVQLQFTGTAGPNAVLSGLFFGAPGSPSLPASSSPAAAFVTADATTQGSWQGVYGAGGYFLPAVNDEGDRHLIVYDQTNNIAYELFNTHRPSDEPDGRWHADSEAVWNMNADSFRTPGFTSADAAGLPILPGLVRPDEVLTQGAITHALRFTVPKTDSAYVFPASHEAGVNNPALPRMGERFRLNPSFDISGFPAADQVILQVLKTYGMIVADNGSSWFLSGSPSDQWNDTTLHSLTSVLGSNFKAVDLTPIVSSLTRTSGATAGGTPVTVHGVNFTGVAGELSVSFGGVAASSVTVVDDNTLIAVAPAHAAGAVDIRITTPYGTSAASAADQFTYTAGLTASAKFVSTNLSTQGSWSGVYGGDGYDVLNDAASLPAYAQLSADANALSYTWARPTSDPRAPQDGPGAATRDAACLYSPTSFNLDLNLSDGKAHQVALYLLDWDTIPRTETVTVADAGTGAVLDTRNASNFGGGQWLVWDLSGHVTITFANTNRLNAVASAVMFDPVAAAAPPAAASFVAADAATQGSWTGVYGADGYSVLGGGTTSLPAYAQLSAGASAQPYVWAASTSDPRAPQGSAGSASRVAGCDYSPTRFSLDLNLTDGKPHQVALYLLDWDTIPRTETVTVADAGTGAVLDARNASNFGGGSYLSWTISGHVTITFTNTNRVNAVLSGVFFG